MNIRSNLHFSSALAKLLGLVAMGTLSIGCLAAAESESDGVQNGLGLFSPQNPSDKLQAGDRILATFELVGPAQNDSSSRGGGIHIWTGGMDPYDPLTLIVVEASTDDWNLYPFAHELHALSAPLTGLQADELNNTSDATGLLANFVSDVNLHASPQGDTELHIAALTADSRDRMEFSPLMVMPVRVVAR